MYYVSHAQYYTYHCSTGHKRRITGEPIRVAQTVTWFVSGHRHTPLFALKSVCVLYIHVCVLT